MNSTQAGNDNDQANDPGSTDFDLLCAQYLDGTLAEVERDRLAELLDSDPAAVAALRSQLLVSGALARLRPERSDETFLRSVLPHLGTVADEAEDAFPDRVRKTIRLERWRRIGLAAAAVVALAGGLVYYLQPQGAVVATSFDGDEPSRPVRTGEKLVFSTGITRMEFTNGAVVAIEAPATLTIRSANEVVLDRGRLNAWCPETAHGFRVVTASATLKDLGTSFGVSAAADGSADFMVLDGKVEVKKDNETRLIERGAALRARRGTRLSDVAFEPSAYHRTWPVASGIRSTRGEVVPAPPGTPESLAALENDAQILVIPERRDFKPAAPIRADIISPGTYEGPNLIAREELTPIEGTRVRSYLLRYNPVGQLKAAGTKRFHGSVTFDRPVLAIITASRKLNRTDSFLTKTPLPKLNAQDTELRGLERQPLPPSDRVELSQDRRTITVTFFADQSIDEIRAVTED
ncbi:FecR domain-containing protein [Luteolibacter arcticus]|uniref:FecR domain-containing protein n=1 Tax=Luteolibacter arcticus TaxID=1581411 RepID=A0ABT3GS11_9BACT|nr:FecR domain-containing protein [Luteolibacter arcticus]MCW1926261.1 FecR domain-containing protein [Luteolibacter arcticus]